MKSLAALAAPLLCLGLCPIAAPARAAAPLPLLRLPLATTPLLAPLAIKGTTLSAQLTLAFDNLVAIEAPAAARARLRAFPFIGKRTVASLLATNGPALFRGNYYGVRLAGAPETSVPTVWSEGLAVAGADALAGVLAVNALRIRFERAGAAPGGRVHALAMRGHDLVEHRVVVAGQPIGLFFDPAAPLTVMNATAAAALGTAGLVRPSGRLANWHPYPKVNLPVESLAAAPGATLAGLPLRAAHVRISAARGAELAQGGRVDAAADDADAIVVTASRSQKPGRAWVTVGRDVLDQCSSLEIDRPAAMLRLMCDFSPPQVAAAR